MGKLELYGIVLIVIALAMGAAYFKGHHAGAQEVQVKFDTFVAKTEAAGEKARADAIQKESHDAKQIADAVTTRNDALTRMRVAQAAADAARRSVSLVPAAASGSSQICFEQKALSAAVEQYRGSVRGLVESGDETTLDAKALIQAWPTTAKAITR